MFVSHETDRKQLFFLIFNIFSLFASHFHMLLQARAETTGVVVRSGWLCVCMVGV